MTEFSKSSSSQAATIDVVMPVYNAEQYLPIAIASVLQQSFTDLRLICVDDGSTDGSTEIMRQFAAEDARVHVIRQENQGLVGALNTGLAAAQAPLIARMDADDIAMPLRFQRQHAFLAANPDVVACGTAILELDSDGDPLGIERFGQQHSEIEGRMLQAKTGMAHPTVMMRRSAVEAAGGYRHQHEWIEDLDLWLRLAEEGHLANLTDVLLCYRQHSSSGSWAVGRIRRERTLAVMEEAHTRRGLSISQSLREKCTADRSPAGPSKWARKASRNGQWAVAKKHLARQWSTQPISPLTWRMTLEVSLRSALSAVQSQEPLPSVPSYNRAA